jgi:hypothetical protein
VIPPLVPSGFPSLTPTAFSASLGNPPPVRVHFASPDQIAPNRR